MDDQRFLALAKEIEAQLPSGYKCAYQDHPYGGVSFFSMEGGVERGRADFDLDKIEDYTDERIVQAALNKFNNEAAG